MFKNLFTSLVLILALSSCTHHSVRKDRENLKREALEKVIHDQRYQNLKNEIIKADATHVKECNCMAAYYRDLFAEPDQSARYIFDGTVGEEALKVKKDSVSVLAIGSGLLLNELSALSHVLVHKKNLKIYLTDWAYLFYDEGDFAEKAVELGRNPDKLPEGYQRFYYWQWARRKNTKSPFLSFFELHNTAIEEFKKVLAGLDKIYGTTSTVEIIKPPATEAVKLPPLDLIIAVDAFTDVPNLMHILHYQMKLSKQPVRFIAMNKLLPLGGFAEARLNDKIEEQDKRPLSLEIYDVWSTDDGGKFQRIGTEQLYPSPLQIEKQEIFKAKAKKRNEWTMSPLDFE